MATRAAKLALRGKALSDTGTEIGIVNNADATAITVDSNENVGIGTSSPATKLDFGVTSNNTQIIHLRKNGNSISALGVNAEYGVRIAGPNDSVAPVTFGVLANASGNAFTEHMRIDSAGNVGIGSAPATDWHANYSVLQVGGQAGIWTHKAVGAGKALHISHNAEYDTGFKFIANDEATLYLQADGAHRFSHGAYGTAGSAISFVERLKIDADGLTFQGNTGGGATALDDYEEGTWSPGLVNGTNNPVGTSITTVTYASYTKIGRQVNVYLYCDGMNFNSSSATFQIAGLPFAPKPNQYGGGSIGYTHNFNVATKHFMVLVNPNGSIYFHRGDGNSNAATNADLAGCSYMLLNANYITDA
jgi:hypothetical protein